jgi:hypothetical protein
MQVVALLKNTLVAAVFLTRIRIQTTHTTRFIVSLPLPAVLRLIASCGTKFPQSILMGKFLLDFPFHCLVKMEIEPLREKYSMSKCMDKL